MAHVITNSVPNPIIHFSLSDHWQRMPAGHRENMKNTMRQHSVQYVRHQTQNLQYYKSLLENLALPSHIHIHVLSQIQDLEKKIASAMTEISPASVNPPIIDLT